MAFIPVPETAKVAIESEYLGEDVVNTLYFQKSGGWDASGLASLAAGVLTWYEAQVLTIQSSQFFLQQVVATDQSVEGGAQAIEPALAGTHGGDGGSPMPGNVAFTISLRTALTGRSNRGRNYIGGITSTWVVGGNQLNTTAVGDWVAAYNALIDLHPGGGALVIASRQHNKVPRVEGVATVVVKALAVDTNLDSQRRRLAGRGT